MSYKSAKNAKTLAMLAWKLTKEKQFKQKCLFKKAKK